MEKEQTLKKALRREEEEKTAAIKSQAKIIVPESEFESKPGQEHLEESGCSCH